MRDLEEQTSKESPIVVNNIPNKHTPVTMVENARDRALALFGSNDDLSTIEQVRNSIQKSLPAVGIEYNNGVLLMSHAWNQDTRLMKKNDIRHLRRLTDEAAVAFAGRSADGRKLINELREHAMEDYDEYDEIVDIKYHVEQISDQMVDFNLELISRPLGVELLVGGFDERGPALYDIEPDGTVTSWSAYAIGRNQSQMLELLEQSYEQSCSLSEAKDLAVECLNNKDVSAKDIHACKIEESGFELIPDSEVRELLVKEGDEE